MLRKQKVHSKIKLLRENYKKTTENTTVICTMNASYVGTATLMCETSEKSNKRSFNKRTLHAAFMV